MKPRYYCTARTPTGWLSIGDGVYLTVDSLELPDGWQNLIPCELSLPNPGELLFSLTPDLKTLAWVAKAMAKSDRRAVLIGAAFNKFGAMVASDGGRIHAHGPADVGKLHPVPAPMIHCALSRKATQLDFYENCYVVAQGEGWRAVTQVNSLSYPDVRPFLNSNAPKVGVDTGYLRKLAQASRAHLPAKSWFRAEIQEDGTLACGDHRSHFFTLPTAAECRVFDLRQLVDALAGRDYWECAASADDSRPLVFTSSEYRAALTSFR